MLVQKSKKSNQCTNSTSQKWVWPRRQSPESEEMRSFECYGCVGIRLLECQIVIMGVAVKAEPSVSDTS